MLLLDNRRGTLLHLLEWNGEALQSYGRALELAPSVTLFWTDRAWIAMRMKKYPEAIADYSKAIDCAPSEARTYELRAKAWAMVGDEEKYNADLRKAKALNEGR